MAVAVQVAKQPILRPVREKRGVLEQIGYGRLGDWRQRFMGMKVPPREKGCKGGRFEISEPGPYVVPKGDGILGSP